METCKKGVFGPESNEYIYAPNSIPPQWFNEALENFQNILAKGEIDSDYTYDGVKTTVGRAALMSVLPKKYWNEIPTFTKGPLKKFLNKLIKDDNKNGHWWITLFNWMGMIAATKGGQAWSEEAFEIPQKFIDKKNDLIKQVENKEIDPYEFEAQLGDLAQELYDDYKKRGVTLVDMPEVGVGSLSDVQHILLCAGVASNIKGDITRIVSNSLADGMDPSDVYTTTSAAIKAQYASAVGSAKPGYLLSQLRHIISGLIISKKTKDCGSTQFIEYRVDGLEDRLGGRYKSDGTMFNPDKDKGIVKFRSPLYCKAEDGICNKCLGTIFEEKGLKPGDPLLIVATASAEITMELTLKAKHSNASLGAAKLDLKEKLLEGIKNYGY
jgi:hypothetical protein